MLLAAFFPAAGQAEELLTSGDYRYRVLGDGTAEITRYGGYAKFLEIPDKLDGLAVTSIGDLAFSGCGGLQKVIVAPDSYAQKYCEERGPPFVFHENTDWLNQ